MKPDQIRGHLDLLLLAILRSGSLHGYALIRALAERSGAAFDMPEGTVYPALHRLEREGLIASDWEVAEGRRRRLYRLSEDGARALSAKETEWRRFAGAVQGVLAWNP
jgi:PadR family transcriptional regulator PadR